MPLVAPPLLPANYDFPGVAPKDGDVIEVGVLKRSEVAGQFLRLISAFLFHRREKGASAGVVGKP